MIAVPISPWLWWSFELKRALFLFAVPVLIGLAVAIMYPLGQRVAKQHGTFLKAWLFGALGPATMLLGWTLIVRTRWTAIPYGLGYGLGVACLSRVHKLTLWPPQVITRQGRVYPRSGAD